MGESDDLPIVEARDDLPPLGFGGSSLGGSGKSGPVSFFRRGRRKKVVVVETVWVVVVVAKTPLSPELRSDLEDSESLETGNANAEFDSSPYGGGFIAFLNLSGSSNVTRDARFD